MCKVLQCLPVPLFFILVLQAAARERERLAVRDVMSRESYDRLDRERLADLDRFADRDRLALADRERLALAERDRLALADRDRLALADRDRLALSDRDRLALLDRDRLALAERDRLALADRDRLTLADRDRLTERERLAQRDYDRYPPRDDLPCKYYVILDMQSIVACRFQTIDFACSTILHVVMKIAVLVFGFVDMLEIRSNVTFTPDSSGLTVTKTRVDYILYYRAYSLYIAGR